MPGSQTSPGRPNACDGASARVAFRPTDSVGTRIQVYFAAQWLAYTLPYRRFADTLTDACVRLGADADRYSFIAVDLHHLLLAGLPAHLLKNSCSAEAENLRPFISRGGSFHAGDQQVPLALQPSACKRRRVRSTALPISPACS